MAYTCDNACTAFFLFLHSAYLYNHEIEDYNCSNVLNAQPTDKKKSTVAGVWWQVKTHKNSTAMGFYSIFM